MQASANQNTSMRLSPEPLLGQLAWLLEHMLFGASSALKLVVALDVVAFQINVHITWIFSI